MQKKGFWILLAGIVVAIVLIRLIKSCNESRPDVIAVQDSTQYYRNKLNQEVAALKQREQDYNRETEGLLDSIASLHNTKKRLIQEVQSLTLKGKVVIATGSVPNIVYRDTGSTKFEPDLDYVEQEFKNPYYTASVFIPFGGDSSKLFLETFDTLRTVVKTVKEGNIFNRRTYIQVDAVNSNPYSTISGLQVYRKPIPKQKKVGIGFQAGYGFSNSLTPSVYVGIGISYNLIKL